MTSRIAHASLPTGLQFSAVGYGVLLSVACLAWGAVYDVVLAGLLLLSVVTLFFADRAAPESIHTKVFRIGLFLFAALGLLAVLQLLFTPSGETSLIWSQTQAMLDGETIKSTAALDKSLWLQRAGSYLLLFTTFLIALVIGSSHTATRLFFQSALISGGVLVALTFSFKTTDILSSRSVYAHGFVNPNNAAAYLGILLLFAIAEGWHFIRRLPGKRNRSLPELIDKLSLGTIIRALLLLFATLLFIGGLFLTGSRGGILLSLATAGGLLLLLISKSARKSGKKRWAQATLGLIVLLALVVGWSFSNFGTRFSESLSREGLDPDARPELIAVLPDMIADHPWLGAGMGSFPSAFQLYRPASLPPEGWYDKAHNSFLEFAVEFGLPGLLLLLSGVGFLFYLVFKGVRERHKRYVEPALGLSIAVFLCLHSLVDFPLQIPALAALVLAAVTLCAIQSDRYFAHSHPSPSE